MDITLKEFVYGRCYQLVLDKSKAVHRAPGRAELIKTYARSRTREQIIEEARRIISTTKKKADWMNIWIDIEDLKESDEYHGRCVQFLLDSNHKRKLIDLIVLGEQKVVEMAHAERMKQLFPKPGGLEFDTSKLCNYMCGGGCSWTYGDKRCSGDNRRYMLEWESLNSLDDTFIHAYPEPY